LQLLPLPLLVLDVMFVMALMVRLCLSTVRSCSVVG
jgi:hypothetical protein